ncbi:hypothetical protein Tco_1258793 [Tanacetum coccineum]
MVWAWAPTLEAYSVKIKDYYFGDVRENNASVPVQCGRAEVELLTMGSMTVDGCTGDAIEEEDCFLWIYDSVLYEFIDTSLALGFEGARYLFPWLLIVRFALPPIAYIS